MANTEEHLFVVMGATGDLMQRKLLPALYNLAVRGTIKNRCITLGVARKADIDDNLFRELARKSLKNAGLTKNGKTTGNWCESCLHYQSIGGGSPEDYKNLALRIKALEKEHGLSGNRIFYLSMPPNAFPGTITNLGKAGLNKSAGWTRLVIEKPFGRDLESAKELNKLVHNYFDESQIYRIDHYLGKETVQNLLVFRFANAIFESLWNRDRVERIEITVAEDLGVEKRASYYEQAGAIRDMVQNHLTQLLTLIAMEPPVALEADPIRNEKIKVLRSIAPIEKNNIVFGQYTSGDINGRPVPGYKEEPGVSPQSVTETFVALKLQIDNWRWQGVPFFMRTAKRLPRRVTKIAVVFRRSPVCLFKHLNTCEVHSNILFITLQPDEGFDLSFDVKAPSESVKLNTHRLLYRYADDADQIPDAYETLLLDIMEGDQTLFVHADEVEASWRLYTPLFQKNIPVHPYPAGTWGPDVSDELLARYGRQWIKLS